MLRDKSLVSFRFVNLKKLQVLDLEENEFVQLPSVLYSLTSLTKLDVSHNLQLVAIDERLLQLQNLKELNCFDSTSLNDPPYTVCEQGLVAVKKYFEDRQA